MTDKPKKLSATARELLSVAALRDDHLIPLPKLPVAAARQVVRSLLNAGYADEVPAPINDPGCAWRTGEDGCVLALQATALGIARALAGDEDSGAPGATVPGGPGARADEQPRDAALIAARSAADPPADANWTCHTEAGQVDPDQGVTAPATALSAEAPETAGTPARPTTCTDGLRRAAQALLNAWDDTGGAHGGLEAIIGPIATLRAALAITADGPASLDTLRSRPDTKQAQVLAMLARSEGASGPQIAGAMGWAPHTVRGFLAGLARKGIKVDVLDRVRQVGPDKSGAKGSYTVYHLAGGAKP